MLLRYLKSYIYNSVAELRITSFFQKIVNHLVVDVEVVDIQVLPPLFVL